MSMNRTEAEEALTLIRRVVNRVHDETIVQNWGTVMVVVGSMDLVAFGITQFLASSAVHRIAPYLIVWAIYLALGLAVNLRVRIRMGGSMSYVERHIWGNGLTYYAACIAIVAIDCWSLGSAKGDRSNLPERPGGCCAQIGPVPFFASPPSWPSKRANPSSLCAKRSTGSVRRRSEKGDRSNLPERPGGCCAQIGPVPFFAIRGRSVHERRRPGTHRLRLHREHDEQRPLEPHRQQRHRISLPRVPHRHDHVPAARLEHRARC